MLIVIYQRLTLTTFYFLTFTITLSLSFYYYYRIIQHQIHRILYSISKFTFQNTIAYRQFTFTLYNISLQDQNPHHIDQVTMQSSNKTRSHKLLHKLSAFGNLDFIHTQSPKQQKNVTFKTIKTLKNLKTFPQNSHKPYHLSNSIKNIHLPKNNNSYQISTKDIDRLYDLMTHEQKSVQIHDQIESLFSQYHISFFETIRNFLPIKEYHELIDRCQLVCFPEGRCICRKGEEDDQFFILLDGDVSFNEEKTIRNTLIGEDQTEYFPIFMAQQGTILNAETLNSPKHNLYSVISHSTATLISLKAGETYSRFFKKYFTKQFDEQSYSLSNTSLFKGIPLQNVKKILPYFFTKNFHKFNETIYRQDQKAEFLYWILDGQVQLIKEETTDEDSGQLDSVNKKVCKIVKLSKYQIFGIDQYVFKPNCKYLFTAKVSSQSLKTICISYKSLTYIQNSFPCLNENIDFYLNRAAAMHSKIVEKNNKIMEVKENIRVVPQKKKNKRNKKKKKNPQSLEWWGLAQNNVGSKRYKLQLPKFITLQQQNSVQSHSKTLPMFDYSNYHSSKIQQFKRKLFENDIDRMIQAEERKKSADEINQSPYKVNYVPKLKQLKIKVLDIKPKAIDETQKVKKKLLSYAKNMDSFCEKLNLD